MSFRRPSGESVESALESMLRSDFGFDCVDVLRYPDMGVYHVVLSRGGLTGVHRLSEGLVMRFGRCHEGDLLRFFCEEIDRSFASEVGRVQSPPPGQVAPHRLASVFAGHVSRMKGLKAEFRRTVARWEGDRGFKEACRWMSMPVPAGFAGPFHTGDGFYPFAFGSRAGRGPVAATEAEVRFVPRPHRAPQPDPGVTTGEFVIEDWYRRD